MLAEKETKVVHSELQSKLRWFEEASKSDCTSVMDRGRHLESNWRLPNFLSHSVALSVPKIQNCGFVHLKSMETGEMLRAQDWAGKDGGIFILPSRSLLIPVNYFSNSLQSQYFEGPVTPLMQVNGEIFITYPKLHGDRSPPLKNNPLGKMHIARGGCIYPHPCLPWRFMLLYSSCSLPPIRLYVYGSSVPTSKLQSLLKENHCTYHSKNW